MVVGVQPGVKGGAAFGFGGVGPGVGPFVGQGAVIALDFAVGLWPVGAGVFGGDAQAGAGGSPQAGNVAAAVVADDAFDGDPGCGVPGVRAGQERGCGFAGLVGQDLGIGQPGVVVEGGVQVAVAQVRAAVDLAAARGVAVGLPVTLAGRPAQDPVAAAVGNVAEFFDIDMDQLARAGPLIAPHGSAAATVQVHQQRA